MSYRLLCLDAGFTLLTPRRPLAEALSDALVDDGRTVTEDEMRAVWEEGDRWFWDEYHRPGNDTWTDDGRIDEYWRHYHSIILRRLGVDARNEVLDRLLEGQFTSDAWELYPDVEPMLAAVREMGVGIGVVSDWGSNLRGIVAGLELDRYLDFVLPSGSVGLAKPNPAFFRMALDAVDVRRTRRSWSATRTAPTSGARGQPASMPYGSTAPRASTSRPPTSRRRPTFSSSAPRRAAGDRSERRAAVARRRRRSHPASSG